MEFSKNREKCQYTEMSCHVFNIMIINRFPSLTTRSVHDDNNENRSFPISINSCHTETLSVFPDPASPHRVVAEAVQVNPVTRVSNAGAEV